MVNNYFKSKEDIFFSLIKFILFTLALWLFLTRSAFDISGNVDKYFQDLFNTHFGAWAYPKTNQDKVAVLLLNDEIVDRSLKGQWPASYSFHANVLSDLLEHQPKAVFIDFYWMNQERPGVKDLIRVLRDYKDENIPVYIAAPSKQWFEGFWSGSEDFENLKQLFTPVSAHINLEPADFVSRTYPKFSQGLESAAFKIAGDLLQIDFSNPSRGDMDIFWGTAQNPKNIAWMDNPSRASHSILSSLQNGYKTVTTEIPYTTTVFVRDLINPRDSSDETQEDLSNHLKDHVIVYGANVTGVQDFVFTPTRNILPGAYYHAMAIDNLLTWHNRYKSGTANLATLPSLHLPLWALQIAVLAPLSIAFLWRRNQIVNLPSANSELIENSHINLKQFFINIIPSIKFWVLISSYVFIVCWYQYAVLDLAVANWIAFVQLLGFGVLIGKLDLVEKVINLTKKFLNQSRLIVQRRVQ